MITDKELLKLAKYKLGVFDLTKDVTQEELERISELSINNMSYSGQPKNIDLTQLSNLTGLRRLDIINFDISSREADAISSLDKLEDLSIMKSNLSAPIQTGPLDSLTVAYSNVDNFEYLPLAQAIDFCEVQEIDASQMMAQVDSLIDLSVSGGSVKKSDRLLSLKKLKTASFVSAKLDNKKVVEELIQNGVEVEYESEQRSTDTLFKQ